MTNDKNLQNDNTDVTVKMMDGALKIFDENRDENAYSCVLMAFKYALEYNRHFLVGIEAPSFEAQKEALAEKAIKGELKPGDKVTLDEPFTFQFIHLPSGEDDKYLIPIYTSSEEACGDTLDMPISDVVDKVINDDHFMGFALNIQSSGPVVHKETIKEMLGFESHDTLEPVPLQEKLKFNRTYLNMLHRTLVNMRKFPDDIPEAFIDNAVKQLMKFDSYVLVDEITYNIFMAPKSKSRNYLLECIGGTEDQFEQNMTKFIEEYKKANSFGDEGKFWIPIYTQEEENTSTNFPKLEKVKISKVISIVDKQADCLGLVFNRFNDTIVFSKKGIEDDMNNPEHEFRLTVLPAGVLDVQAEAIVNSANEDFSPDGGGLNEALFKAAGKNMITQIRRENCCEIAGAKVTGSCYLDNCTFVVHAVPPKWTGVAEDKVKLGRCYLDCFLALSGMSTAIQAQNSVAFPLLGAGKGGFPPEISAECLLKTMELWQEKGGMPFGVYLCCYTKEEYDVVMKFLNQK